MKPHSGIPHGTTTDRTAVSPTRMFAALAEKRRQYALEYLAQKPAAIPVGDLAEYVAITEGTPTYEWYQRILVDLVHNHLPHLVDADLVRYDVDAELVSLAVERDVLSPYLELATQEE